MRSRGSISTATVLGVVAATTQIAAPYLRGQEIGWYDGVSALVLGVSMFVVAYFLSGWSARRHTEGEND